MKTLVFKLEGSPADEWYDGGIHNFEVNLENEDAEKIESLAKESDGYITKEMIEDKYPELSEIIDDEARSAFLDELVLESWNYSGTEILDTDLEDDFNEDKFNAMEPNEAAAYLRKFGAEIEMVDETYSYSFEIEES